MEKTTYTLSYEYSPDRLVFDCPLLSQKIYATTPKQLCIKVQEKMEMPVEDLEKLIKYANMLYDGR